MSGSQTDPGGAKQERRRKSRFGLIGQSEIGEHPAGEQHRQPKEPAVLLGFERTR
jgi:hypothetical protein